VKIIDSVYGSDTQPYLQLARQLCEGHHERFDGGGYPYGRKGEDIPLCCRLIAILNVYISCRSPRVWRPSLSHSETCAVIFSGRGKAFDPLIADAFMEIRNEFER
jgi:putative two-component system response regulator